MVREGVVVRFDIERRRGEERDILGGSGEGEENIPITNSISPHTTIQHSFSSPLFPLPFLFQLKITILAF